MGNAISMANFENRPEDDKLDECTEQVERFRESVRFLKESLDLQIEHNGYFATIIRAKFMVLMEAGFTEQQALMLCR